MRAAAPGNDTVPRPERPAPIERIERVTATPRTLPAPDEEPRPLSGGWWRLRRHAATPWELYVRVTDGADGAVGGTIGGAGGTIGGAGGTVPPSSVVRVEWCGDAVRWEIGPPGLGTPRHAATGGLLHEPYPDLYASLPLARYDRRARRFWSVILWIARWPGGRAMIERLARRRRTTGSA